MKAKLLALISCCTILSGCAGYDNAFCRADYCTDTAYQPNSYSDNASYSCGQVGSGSCMGRSSGGGSSCSSGGGGGGGMNCSSLGCKENVWDNPGSLEGN